MPAPAYRSHTTIAWSATSIRSINVPTGVVDGDLLLAVVITSSYNQTINTPDGWEILTTTFTTGNTGNPSHSLHAFWRYASSEPTSYTFTSPNTVIGLVAMVAVQDPAPAQPFDFTDYTNRTTASTTQTLPSRATKTDNTLILSFISIRNNPAITDLAPPAGMTERFDTNANTLHLALADVGQTTAGAITGGSWTSATSVPVLLTTLAVSSVDTPPDSRLAQQAVETLVQATDPEARLAQQTLETLVQSSAPEARLAQQVIEVLVQGSPAPATGNDPIKTKPNAPGGKPGPGKGGQGKPNRPILGGNLVPRKLRLGGG